MRQLSVKSTIAIPGIPADAKPRANRTPWSVDGAIRFGRWASLAILPMIALIGSVVGGPSATDAFLSECNRIYAPGACSCAASRAEAAVGSSRFAQISSEIFMHPQLQGTATRVVQSCMLGGTEIAD